MTSSNPQKWLKTKTINDVDEPVKTATGESFKVFISAVHLVHLLPI